MPVVTVELNARQDTVGNPILWRLGKLFNVVTNIRRARVTEDYGHVVADMEGSTEEVAQARTYLQGLGLTPGGALLVAPEAPEGDITQSNTISVGLETVNAQQGHAPILHRVGRDFNVVVNIVRAAFDDEEGGNLDITISGALANVQRAIAYLHTTGIHVNPRQRSVTDFGNL